MDQHSVDVNPHELHHAQSCWANFTRITKYVVLASAVILILMAAFLL